MPKILAAELPKLEEVALPYDLYTPHDLAHRVVYVEASRGCPFTCEFCLSSLDIPVRQFPLEPFLAAMDRLLARGATQFKFVDRTFNLNLMVSRAILQFFLARMRPGLFVHFEMVPDRLPEPLRAVIAQFPAGSLQFEVGVQTFDEAASRHISRRQDHGKLAENLTWLRGHTGVHVHADLIVGLPSEGLASFARGFDRLVALGPQEIQVGMLKRLRGTPIVRHDAEFQMRYSGEPPYELLQNRDLDFPTMQRLRRFARYWDLVANSGNFPTSTPLLWTDPVNSPSDPAKPETQNSERPSPFWRFLAFSDWLYARLGQRHGIALVSLAEALYDHLVTERHLPPATALTALRTDFERAGRRERPPFMQEKSHAEARPTGSARPPTAPKRQARHTAPAKTDSAADHPA
ncbi:MAG: B12-binding domain-containing radical SAM protein [Pedosphaera sp. Tous-C6FEB]|nr:MAG: B12-binding domain-containing radical SAM protein [Pedosphaera sp. Tous-C6FEB]